MINKEISYNSVKFESSQRTILQTPLYAAIYTLSHRSTEELQNFQIT
jgi:hypothetical protein